ncbi:hypothetical protein FRC01_005801 [Tulasnella sp. 417]|nr:hypothetical protein FRC01_005801 [Tulasnella sp. 417]
MDSDNLPEDIDLVFRGIDGAEAESFIRSVLRTARTEGKIRDNEWIVDLVSACMMGEALRWYIELDEDTQNDWKLLRKAILRQYSSSTQPAQSQPTVPTPPAAARPPSSVSIVQPAQAPNPTYRIRLYFANTKSEFYLFNNEGRVRLTKDDAKACRVRWTPGGELRLVENIFTLRMNSEDHPENISLVFKGIDGPEAESFISLVRLTAGAEGRLRDNERIVDLVSTFMKGRPLRWYFELVEDTQTDWKLLRKVIPRQYSPNAELLAPLRPTVPILAAATSPNLISIT